MAKLLLRYRILETPETRMNYEKGADFVLLFEGMKVKFERR